MTQLSNELSKVHPFHSEQLFSLKDLLFTAYETINPYVFGQIESAENAFKEMFSGSMSALRNPKAHDNLSIDPADAMRQRKHSQPKKTA